MPNSYSTDNPENFRFISVVLIVAKMLEKIVAVQLSSYFESNQSLNSEHNLSSSDCTMVPTATICNCSVDLSGRYTHW